MSLAKNLLTSALLAAFASGACAGEGDPITAAELPVMAATRIFALENHVHGDIAVAGEDEGHIGESFEVNHVPGEKCTFTMRRKDGPVVEIINFDRLSTEIHISRQDGFAKLVVTGQPGAQCDIENGAKKCYAGLEMMLMFEGSPSEIDLAKRALSYIFSNVCTPAQLPF